ncbi:MAG: helix-turn-helix domain-containing protein [Verrucomicrobia bacterium]|nr:helix-turn-helix domain-containing protein [Verrucomicrobiota bacterium]MBT7701895.1 helix-turn-helix domain-containing protein [Verrucomicrobiota bacterium]
MDREPTYAACESGNGLRDAASKAIQQQHLKAIGRSQLSDNLTELFSELTGWTFRVRWAPALGWHSTLPLRGTEFCDAVCQEPYAATVCAEFETACVTSTLEADQTGHAFCCPFGIHSYWHAVSTDSIPVAIIAVQFPKSAKSRQLRRALRALQEAPDDPLPMPPSAQRHFEHAKALTQVLADELRQSILAESRQADIHRLTQNVTAHEHVEASLRKDLHSMLPFVTEDVPAPESGNHHDQMIQGILEHIHAHYDQPLRLQELADARGVNMAHLSTLFSQTVGIPFRTYVKELRLEKALAPLRDPNQRVSEIAYAIGYSDPNRFRLDFKARTGLSPTAWRDTLR